MRFVANFITFSSSAIILKLLRFDKVTESLQVGATFEVV